MTKEATLPAMTELISCADVINRDHVEEVKVCGVRALAALCQRNPSYIATQIGKGQGVDKLFAGLQNIILEEQFKVSN